MKATASLTLALLFAAGAAMAQTAKAPDTLVAQSWNPGAMQWTVLRPHAGAHMTLRTPAGQILAKDFGPAELPAIAVHGNDGALLADGLYVWEITVTPMVDAATREALTAAHRDGTDLPPALQAQVDQWSRDNVRAGSFRVQDGVIVDPSLVEEPARKPESSGKPATSGVEIQADTTPTPADVVYADDLIVQGSTCTGFDCVNGEDFGSDTIRIKENNTRINFDDTSTGSFPLNDWRLYANDQASGGRNLFYLEDATAGREVFSVEAGARANALYVEGDGDVGIGTTNPGLELHAVGGNTPGLRLEQNISSGYAAQTWDLAGNEAVFFVRDVTHSSKIPFLIEPNAPSRSLYVRSDGDVSMRQDNTDAAASLHIRRTNGTGSLRVEEASTTTADRELARFINNGNAGITLQNTNASSYWSMYNVGTHFDISNSASISALLSLDSAGNLGVDGMVTQGSSRAIKQNLLALDPQDVLCRLAEIPITQWEYIADAGEARHVGPMAEDFYAAFGLGRDDAHLAPGDAAGVALAGIQALHAENLEKDQKIQQLEQANADLAARNQELAARLDALASAVAALQESAASTGIAPSAN